MDHQSRRVLALIRNLVLSFAALLAAGAHGQNVEQLYTNYCASCHGTNFVGGNADSLLNDDWKTDGSDRALYNAIADGMETFGMPGYKEGLTEPQMWALVVLIREKHYNHKRAQEGNARAVDGVYPSKYHGYKVETLIENMPRVDRPWAIDFLPGGRMIFTERSGYLYVCSEGTKDPVEITGLPRVWEHGQGGLMDVAVHPNYAENGWIYLSYSDQSERGRGMTKIIRGRIDEQNHQWVGQEDLFRSPPELDGGGGIHWGSRFVFDGKGHVFFTIGERGQGMRAQQLDKPDGKVYRINEDGSIPQDNPFVDREEAIKAIWSLGHRNPQGLAMHPVTGHLYDIEHAPRGGDEINLVEPGNNYGWPVVSYTMNYNATPYGNSAPWHAERGFVEPIYYWLPAIAQCGSSFYTGDAFAEWKNDLFVAALAKAEIHRVRLSEDGRSVVEDEVLLRGIGRVRDVVTGPDGCLYVAVEQPGRIVRLTPGE